MADPNNPTDPTRRVVNPNRINPATVQFNRIDSRGGEKTTDSDLLQEIKDTIESTLGKKLDTINSTLEDAASGGTPSEDLKKILNNGSRTAQKSPQDAMKASLDRLNHAVSVMTKAISTMAGDGGGGEPPQGGEGGGSHGDKQSDFANIAHFQNVRRIYDSTEKIFRMARRADFGAFQPRVMKSMLREGSNIGDEKIKRSQRTAISGFIDSVADVKVRLLDFSGTIRKVTDTLSGVLKQQFPTTSGTGTIGIVDAGVNELTSSYKYLAGESDNFIQTLVGVRKALDTGLVSPMLVSGKSLKEYSQETLKARDAAKNFGTNWSRAMTGEEFNQMLATNRDALRTGGANIRDLNDPQLQRETRRQFDLFSTIAANTGRTVQELVKMNKENTIDIQNSAAAGIISQEEGTNLSRASEMLTGMGQTGLAEYVKTYAARGGSDTGGLFLRADQNFQKLPANVQDAILNMFQDMSTRGESAVGSGFAKLQSETQAYRAQGLNPGVAQYMMEGPNRGLMGEINRGAVIKQEIQPETGQADDLLNRYRTFMQNSGAFKGVFEAINATTENLGKSALELLGLVAVAKIFGKSMGMAAGVLGTIATGILGGAGGLVGKLAKLAIPGLGLAAGALAGGAGTAANAAAGLTGVAAGAAGTAGVAGAGIAGAAAGAAGTAANAGAGVAGAATGVGAKSVASAAKTFGGKLPWIGGLISGLATYMTGGGTFESLGSGIGSVGGGVLGGMGGALLGGAGAVPGAIAGGMGGEWLGSALGKYLDEKFGTGPNQAHAAEAITGMGPAQALTTEKLPVDESGVITLPPLDIEGIAPESFDGIDLQKMLDMAIDKVNFRQDLQLNRFDDMIDILKEATTYLKSSVDIQIGIRDRIGSPITPPVVPTFDDSRPSTSIGAYRMGMS